MTRSGTPYLLPMVVVSVAFFAIPLLLLVVYSFWGEQGLTFDYYRRFLGDPYNFRVVMNTARLGLYTVLGTTLVGLPIALMYYHSGRTIRQLIIFLCLVPMLTSNVVRTFAWIVILGRNGPLNDMLMALGIFETRSSFMFTEIGLVMAMVQIDLPLLVLPLIAVMTQMPRQLADAAAVAGAGPWRTLFTVLVPVLLPGLIAGWILVFASSTSSYVTQAAIGGARNVYVPQLIYREVGVLFDWPMASAIAVVLLLATGTVLMGLAVLARHRRLVHHG